MVLFNRMAHFRISPVLFNKLAWTASLLLSFVRCRRLGWLPPASQNPTRSWIRTDEVTSGTWIVNDNVAWSWTDSELNIQVQLQRKSRLENGKHVRHSCWLRWEKMLKTHGCGYLPWGMPICHLFWCSPQGFDASPNSEIAVSLGWSQNNLWEDRKLPNKVAIRWPMVTQELLVTSYFNGHQWSSMAGLIRWLPTIVKCLVAGGISRDAPATQGVVPAIHWKGERHGFLHARNLVITGSIGQPWQLWQANKPIPREIGEEVA